MSDAPSGDLPLLGFGLPVSGSWATPDTMSEVAQRAEQLGYHALWSFQRLLFPAEGGLDTAWERDHNPATRSANDASYQAVHDVLLPLAFVAAHTSRIRLGTATICAPFIAPAVLAKATTTLDHLSAGRLDVGVGIGWLPHEYTATGVPYSRRGDRMEEYLRCLVALWTEDPVEFEGEFYLVPRSHAGVRPLQSPRPPLLVGGAAPAALRRAGRLADGWIASSRQDLTAIGSSARLVREAAEGAGRDPEAVRIVVRGIVGLEEEDAGVGRRPLHGSREQVVDDLRLLRAQGVTEVFLDLNFSPRVGSPHVDAAAATAHAREVLEAFAPASLR